VTNLFDEAKVLLTINSEDGYYAQRKTVVLSGKFEFDILSNKDEGLAKGSYKATIILPISGVQSIEFVKLAGIEYENLTGLLVRRNGIVAPFVEYGFDFVVP